MTKLLVHNTSVALWQNLIQEAAEKAHIRLSEESESYLVFLLMRFCTEPSLTHNVMALEFLNSEQLMPFAKKEALREVGDKCLLYSGLYPAHARRKNVHIEYFVKLGRTAYLHVADLTEKNIAKMFLNLSKEFIPLMEVLLTSWDVDLNKKLLPIEIYDIWQLTHSERIKDFLPTYLRKLH